MQVPKNEIVRKQRKVFSRDRSGGSRNISQKKIRLNNQPSSPINHLSPQPKYMIVGLRNELSTLKQEVARLSRHNNPLSPQQNQIRMEYQGFSPRQKKSINTYYFEGSQKRLSKSNHNSINQPISESYSPKTDEPAQSFSVQLILQELQQSRQLNQHLQNKNQQLRAQMGQVGDQLKKQYEGKIRQMEYQKDRRMMSRQRENDRTVTAQRLNQEQKKITEELREELILTSNEILNLKKQNNQLRQNEIKIKQLQQKLKQKEDIEQETRIKSLNISKLQHQLRKIMSQNKALKDQIQFSDDLFRRFQLNLQQLSTQLQSTQLKCNQFQTNFKNVTIQLNRYKEQENLQMNQKVKLKIKQLQHIIDMQDKGMENYESDFSYLEKQLQKYTPLKISCRNLTALTETLNEQCLSLNLKFLNHKYS